MAYLSEKKAQASAPFELFVAVIIMAFVIVVGYQALDRVNTEVCLNNVDKTMKDFKLGLEDTVARKTLSKIFFNAEGVCFNSKNAVVSISLQTQKGVCQARCGYPAESCYVMTFSNPKIPYAFKEKCLEIPTYTSFSVGNTGECEHADFADYTSIDPTSSNMQLLPGSYIFRNDSTAGLTYPKICVFYKPSG